MGRSPPVICKKPLKTQHSKLLVSSNGVLRPSYFCFKRRCFDISKESFQSVIVAYFSKIRLVRPFYSFLNIPWFGHLCLCLKTFDRINHPFNTKSVTIFFKGIPIALIRPLLLSYFLTMKIRFGGPASMFHLKTEKVPYQ